MSRRTMLWGMVAVLLLATALRLAAFGQIPPGLYHDEAYHGNDALRVLAGHPALYFPANNGREPLFIYLISASVGLLGPSPFALRLPSFFAGLLTVAATAAMGRVLFSRRVGLLAAAVLAVTLWHVHLSRVGFRAVLLPLFIALTTWQAAQGSKETWFLGKNQVSHPRGGRTRHWLAAGIFYGLSFYTYTAARFTPVALAVWGLYALLAHGRARDRRLWRSVGWAGLAALVTLAPLAAYTLGHPVVVLGRPGQVSILNPAINHGDLWGTVCANTLRTLGMFFVRGDRIWRHNLPWRPVFDPALGAAFFLGTLVALRRARRDPASSFLLLWTAVMCLPTLLAEDAPHFLRAVGLLPVVVLLPALGLEQVGKWLPPTPYSLSLTPYFLLLTGLISTTRAYFYDYAHDPLSGYWFERGAVALAERINTFVDTGEAEEQQVYLAPELQVAWRQQLEFLLTAPDAVKPVAKAKIQNRVAVFTWPYEDWRWAWSLLPSPAEITIEEGPLSQGDLDTVPYTTYLAFFAVPPGPAGPPLARFSAGVELLGVEVTPMDGEQVRVRLRWRATAPLDDDYTIFLHYLRDDANLAQADSRPGGGHYPTRSWRAGDVIDDDHFVDGVGQPLPGRDRLLFGFWQPESGAKLYLLDEAGNPVGDWLEVEVAK